MGSAPVGAEGWRGERSARRHHRPPQGRPEPLGIRLAPARDGARPAAAPWPPCPRSCRPRTAWFSGFCLYHEPRLLVQADRVLVRGEDVEAKLLDLEVSPCPGDQRREQAPRHTAASPGAVNPQGLNAHRMTGAAVRFLLGLDRADHRFAPSATRQSRSGLSQATSIERCSSPPVTVTSNGVWTA